MSHRLRGTLIAAISGLGLAILMFFPRVLTFGVGLGATLTFALAVGLLDALGTLRISRDAVPAGTAPPAPIDFAPLRLLLERFEPRLLWLGVALAVAGAARLSVAGSPADAAPLSGPILLGLAAVALAVGFALRHRSDGDPHAGFGVLAIATAMVMATLGTHGLWDCWETHYGEVARRQLEQDDWISLWWQDKWFYSKPILIFWMMNLGMALFAVGIGPDSISAHAEWGVRFFIGALAIAVVFAVYQLLARRVSRRAGVFGAAVLATMPIWAFMSRQAITDLPFVGLMTLAVVFFLSGATADPGARIRPLLRLPLGRGRRLELTALHGVIAGYAAVGLPQMLYLATRSATFRKGTLGAGDLSVVESEVAWLDLRLSDHFESVLGFQLGSAVDLSADWMLVGGLYLVVFLLLLRSLRRVRSVERLSYHAMYLCLALSVMAKGLPGLAMPILGLVGLWFFLAPWRRLAGPGGGVGALVRWHVDKLKRLDLARGVPLFLLTASPWFVAMVLRHGDRFIERFFIHDHIKRLSVGVHGDDGTIEYFVQQIGYAALPWIALVPFAALAWIAWRRRERSAPESTADRTQRILRVFTTSWAALSFVLLSMMVTRFHHYVCPVVPPLAILVALLLEDMWIGRVRRVGPVVLVGVVILAAVARDLAVDPGAKRGVLEGYAQLVGLFIYKYSRPFPEGAGYDYTAPVVGFAVAFGALLLALLRERWRRGAIALLLVAAFAFEHWLTQHYMIDLAPHWTQKHLIDEYYARRTSPAERLVAFQMNWKGENFYTGNRVVVHVSTKNKNFEKWCDDHRRERHFFITEQKRYKRMSRRAHAASGPLVRFEDTCNKYEAGVADEL